MLLNYITGVLPELNVYGVSQMTMEQLFNGLFVRGLGQVLADQAGGKGVTPAVKGGSCLF